MLDDEFEVRFKHGASRIPESQGDLGYVIITGGQVFCGDFSTSFESFHSLMAALVLNFGSGIKG